MKNQLLYKSILLIAIVTMLSGLGQVFSASTVLNLVGASVDKTSSHFFAIVGMFMFLFGAVLLQGLRSESGGSVPVFWSGMQKFGAAIAVGLGVYHSVFSGLALGVAMFDLFSGILILAYWRKLAVR